MKYLRLAVIVAIAVIASPTYAGQGDSVTVGAVLAPITSPGPSQMTGTFVDEESGNTYSFFLEGKEAMEGPPGVQSQSRATFALGGPNLHGCTIRKGSNNPQPQLLPSTTPFAYGGTMPYFQNGIGGCGTANAQSVSIHDCVARIQAHGFIHSDDPFVTYFGATTIEVHYKKNSARAKDEIQIKLYTPKHVIKLEGKASVTDGTSSMSNCR